MAWSGSDILYIISEEMLVSPEGKFGGRRSPGFLSRYVCGLSRFGSEGPAVLTLEEYARGILRSSVKKSC
jgi:hypothetical protein